MLNYVVGISPRGGNINSIYYATLEIYVILRISVGIFEINSRDVSILNIGLINYIFVLLALSIHLDSRYNRDFSYTFKKSKIQNSCVNIGI